MSNPKWLVAALFLAFTAMGCRKTVPVTSAEGAVATPAAIARAVDFTYLSSRGKIQFEGEGNKLSSAVNIRIKKDSAIWISVVPMLGIEAARALLTPDSVKILNRLERSYISTNYRFLERMYGIKTDYRTIQELLVGNQPFPVSGSVKIIQTEPQLHTLQMQGNVKVNSFIDLNNLKLQKIQLTDSVAKNSLAVTYADFGDLGTFVFPYSAIFMAQQTKTEPPKSAVITVNHQKVSVSEASLAFPFDIPSGYTRLR